MGGGSSSSQESNTSTTTYNYDEDIVLEGGGIAVGREGVYVPQEVQEDAQGVQAQDSTVAQMDDSNLYVLGNNSSMHITDMDEETENVIIRALEVSARNAENFMNLAAGNEVDNPQGEIDTAVLTTR